MAEAVKFAKSVETDPVEPQRVSQMKVKVDETTPAVLAGTQLHLLCLSVSILVFVTCDEDKIGLWRERIKASF